MTESNTQLHTARARGDGATRCSVTDCRSKPGDYTRAGRCEKHDAMMKLAEILQPGQTIYTILRHVTRSGMGRSVSVITHDGDGPSDVTYLVARALGEKVDKHGGVMMGGAGYDAGFELVYRLSRAIFPEYHCTGKDGYGEDRCPSNEHVNPPRPKPDGTTLHKDGYALRQRWL